MYLPVLRVIVPLICSVRNLTAEPRGHIGRWRHAMIQLAIAAVASAVPIGAWSAPAQVVVTSVTFEDIKPAGAVMNSNWFSIGKDEAGRIYIGFTGKRSNGLQDYYLFRWDPATKARKYLGSFIDVSTAAGNYVAGEEIPKGHTHIVNIGGKLYLGSQSFHDIAWDQLPLLPKYRGAHLYCFDPATDRMTDVSAAMPRGVVRDHEGILGLGYLHFGDLFAAQSHPSSDIILYNYRTNTVSKIVPGIPACGNNHVSPQIVATQQGKVYTFRGTEPFSDRAKSYNVYEYDIASGQSRIADFKVTNGFWCGETHTCDEQSIYIATVQGDLYRLKTATSQWTRLGLLAPAQMLSDGGHIQYLYGITLSPDEKSIFAVPSVATAPVKSGTLYKYDIATGVVSAVVDLGHGDYCGSDVRDASGWIYMAGFGNATDDWADGNCRLV
jgi:hypothetical protein